MVVAAAALVILIGWFGVSYWQHRGLVGLKVVAVPKGSSLIVDGNAARAGRIYVKPGIHKLTASWPSFENDTKTVDTMDYVRGQTIFMLPNPVSAEAKKWLADHPDVQREREAAGGAEADRAQQILLKKYPVLVHLPVNNSHYKIDYGFDDNQKIKFSVTLYAIINGPADYPQYLEQIKQYKIEALDFLKSYGVSPANSTIEFTPNV